MVHGAIALGDGVVPRPSDAAIAAARDDVLAALWGPSWEAGTLDDADRRLHDTRRGVARPEVELVGGLARHQRHDPVGAAGKVDLRHHPVALDVDDDPRQPVARARARVRPALAQYACEL